MNASKSGAVIAVVAIPALVFGGMVAFLLLLSGNEEDAGQGAAALCGGDGVSITVSSTELPAEVAGFSGRQLENAAVIVTVAAERDLDQRAAVIGVMTAIAESRLQNLANAGEFLYPPGSRVMTSSQWAEAREVAMLSLEYPNDGVAPGDWDSIGLFQSRPAAGWGGDGSPEEQVQNLLNPAYTAREFFAALVRVDGWESMGLGAAAQEVQRSAFPSAYDENEPAARLIVAAVQGVEATVDGLDSCEPAYAGTVSADGWVHPSSGYTLLTGRFGDVRVGYEHQGLDFAGPLDTPIHAAADGVVTHVSCERWEGRSPCNVRIDHGTDTEGRVVSTLYVHMYASGVHVQVGDEVTAGDHIADMGSNGNSTGSHLHFEVWLDERPVDPESFLPSVGVALR
ncbi:MAG TPA: M23 family metallopeptidase [Candidatus Ruania gallistercoris]|uniref:M23 family metallopeptidase n=1 Tax=Candidatus Ruania gallistercoris TaxID=2838746 RepID=A0A9D2EFX6_9MICO|nr:M23 family metallopeptidase [Candidatus Ruania gallistercoris]